MVSTLRHPEPLKRGSTYQTDILLKYVLNQKPESSISFLRQQKFTFLEKDQKSAWLEATLLVG